MRAVSSTLFAAVLTVAACATPTGSAGDGNLNYGLLSNKGVPQAEKNGYGKYRYARNVISLIRGSRFSHKGFNGFRHIDQFSDEELDKRYFSNQISLIVEDAERKEETANRIRQFGYQAWVGLGHQVVAILPEHGPGAIRKHWVILDNIPGVIIASPRGMIRIPESEFVTHRRSVMLAPNDPLYASNGTVLLPSGWPSGYGSSPTPTPEPNQSPLAAIGAEEAWAVPGMRSLAAKLAIIEPGFENHEDVDWALGRNCNPSMVPTATPNCVSSGWRNNPNSNFNGHGTIVSGIAGATANNSTGIAGAAWYSWMMGYSVGELNGQAVLCAPDSVLAAVTHFLNTYSSGPRVINASFGGDGDFTENAAAVALAHTEGAIFVAAAGNNGLSEGYTGGIDYPAAYIETEANQTNRYDNVVAVTSLTASRTSGNSSYGSGVTISAPGANILSTAAGGGYGDAGGDNGATSFSTPMVSGALSAIWSACDEVPYELLLHAMRISATDTNAGSATEGGGSGCSEPDDDDRCWDSHFGFGMFNYIGTYDYLANSGLIYQWKPENGSNYPTYGYRSHPRDSITYKDFDKAAFQFSATGGTNLSEMRIVWNLTGDFKILKRSDSYSGYYQLDDHVGYIATSDTVSGYTTPIYCYKTSSGTLGHLYTTDSSAPTGYEADGAQPYGYAKSLSYLVQQ